MSRKEAVLLVSRALAIIQLITALDELTYFPNRIIALLHHAQHDSVLPPSNVHTYFSTYFTLNDRVELAFLCVRTAAFLILAVVFWNCGPWIERVLLSKSEDQEESAGA